MFRRRKAFPNFPYCRNFLTDSLWNSSVRRDIAEFRKALTAYSLLSRRNFARTVFHKALTECSLSTRRNFAHTVFHMALTECSLSTRRNFARTAFRMELRAYSLYNRSGI